MVDNGRVAFLCEKAGAAKHPMPCLRRREGSRVPSPMHHVLAGDMGKGEPVVVSVDIVKVIPAFPKKRAVRIARHGGARPRMREVKGEPVCRHLLRPRRGLDDKGDFLPRLAKHLATYAIEHQPAVLHFCAARDLRNQKTPGAFLRFAVIKRPPSPRFRVGFHVGLQRRDLIRGQRPIVNARVVDRPGEMRHVGLPAMTLPHHHDAPRAELLRLGGHGVLRVLPSVAIRGDLPAFVNHRDLHERLRILRLRREAGLILLCAGKHIAPRHPFRSREFAKNDAIEPVAPIVDRQRAASALREVRRRDPDDQRLVGQGRIGRLRNGG